MYGVLKEFKIFYPIGSGGNPLDPDGMGGFKNNGLPNHEYNAAVSASELSPSQFSLVLTNLMAHENDTYHLSYNYCTTRAMEAFNLLIVPPIICSLFVVNLGQGMPLQIYAQSPQKLYKSMEALIPGPNIFKEFNVVNDSPLSTQICP